MGDEIIGLREIEATTNIPGSTLKWYLRYFAEFVPIVTQGGKGRPVRLKLEAIEVFQAIRAGFEAGHSKTEIRDDLARRFPITLHPAQTHDQAEPPTPKTTPDDNLTTQLGDALAIIANQREEIHRLADQLANLDARLKAIEAARPTSPAPWWRRLLVFK